MWEKGSEGITREHDASGKMMGFGDERRDCMVVVEGMGTRGGGNRGRFAERGGFVPGFVQL